MPRLCFILIAGLDQDLLHRTPHLKALSRFAARLPLKPVVPAVTSTMQATLTTGVLPSQHGIIANGLYTHNRPEIHPLLDLTSHPEFRRETSFWEQSTKLVTAKRFWEGHNKKVAMLFFQNSMGDQGEVADIVITPKPTHSPDGKTLTALWTNPAQLYPDLTAKFGPFPLMHYWGPMAGLPCSQWILRAADEVWKNHQPDIQLVYLPHLDYNLQRRGPQDPSVIKDLQDLDAALLPFIDTLQNSGTRIVIAGDYSMTPVSTPILPNLAFRQAGLLVTKPDEAGKLLVDYDSSVAFAMADHQIAHIYAHAGHLPEIVTLLHSLPGVDRLLTTLELEALGLAHPRSGNFVALAKPEAWFAHDWWPQGAAGDAERPAWQFSVDIHRKPGYDPRELFFDPGRKCIPQDPALVKGSHGLVFHDPARWPVLLCNPSFAPPTATIAALDVAAWLRELL